MTYLSEEEIYVCKRALEVYNQHKNKQRDNYEIMNKKKFNYGDVVIKRGAGEGTLGIIVGHYECDGIANHIFDMYRVYYCPELPYLGANGSLLELYAGEVPEHLKNIKWNEIKEFTVRL